jgi:hypothetical protein
MYNKSFVIVIYNHNDTDLYYKTIILANLNLARGVNYNRKVHFKLKGTFTIVDYNHKTFIVEATDLASSKISFYKTCNRCNKTFYALAY